MILQQTAIKERTSRRFNDWAGKYDRSYLQKLVFRDSHDVFINEIERRSRGDRLCVLDVGCGTGEFMAKMLRSASNMDLHGIDISREMINIASSKFKDENVHFKVGDVEDLPYEDGMFDVITCSHSFHHYPDQKKAITEMYRVLRKNGSLMIVDGSRDSVLGKIIFGIYIKKREKDIYHILAGELKDMFNAIGFKDITQKKVNPFSIPLLFTRGTKE